MNGLGYIVHLEKKNGNSPNIYGWSMQKHRSFSRRSVAESEKLSEKTQKSFREDIASNIFYVFQHLSRCEAPQYKWMETLLQGRKADATNRIILLFFLLLMGIKIQYNLKRKSLKMHVLDGTKWLKIIKINLIFFKNLEDFGY